MSYFSIRVPVTNAMTVSAGTLVSNFVETWDLDSTSDMPAIHNDLRTCFRYMRLRSVAVTWIPYYTIGQFQTVYDSLDAYNGTNIAQLPTIYWFWDYRIPTVTTSLNQFERPDATFKVWNKALRTWNKPVYRRGVDNIDGTAFLGGPLQKEWVGSDETAAICGALHWAIDHGMNSQLGTQTIGAIKMTYWLDYKELRYDQGQT